MLLWFNTSDPNGFNRLGSEYPFTNQNNLLEMPNTKTDFRSKTVRPAKNLEQKEEAKEPVSQNQENEESKNERILKEQTKTKFVRAVYLIVLFQVTLTFLLWYFSSIFNPLSRFWNNIIVILLSNFFLLGSIIVFFLTNISQVFPHNYILLFIFTASESSMIAGWTADLKTDTIILWVGMFMSTTGILTIRLYTMTRDNQKSGLLYTLVISIILQIVVAYFWLASSFWTMLASGISVLGYGWFLIINTNKISKELPLDEYILGSLLLYIDCLTFFIYLLKAFGKKKGR